MFAQRRPTPRTSPISTSRPLSAGELGHPLVGIDAEHVAPLRWNGRAEMPVPIPTSRTSCPGLEARIASTMAFG